MSRQNDMEHLPDEGEDIGDWPAPARGEEAQVFISVVCFVGLVSWLVSVAIEVLR